MMSKNLIKLGFVLALFGFLAMALAAPEGYNRKRGYGRSSSSSDCSSSSSYSGFSHNFGGGYWKSNYNYRGGKSCESDGGFDLFGDLHFSESDSDAWDLYGIFSDEHDTESTERRDDRPGGGDGGNPGCGSGGNCGGGNPGDKPGDKPGKDTPGSGNDKDNNNNPPTGGDNNENSAAEYTNTAIPAILSIAVMVLAVVFG